MAKQSDPKIEIKASMTGAENWQEWCKDKSKNVNSNHGTSGALYFVGFVGAVVYWMQAAVGFGAVVMGFSRPYLRLSFFNRKKREAKKRQPAEDT
jgi:hypothetical protein